MHHQINVEHIGKIKLNLLNGPQQIDKGIMGKDLEIVEELIDQIRELCNTDNLDILINSVRLSLVITLVEQRRTVKTV